MPTFSFSKCLIAIKLHSTEGKSPWRDAGVLTLMHKGELPIRRSTSDADLEKVSGVYL